ncbi:hypothetical protein KUTeg_002994 [Tegillarca granosa]|uniref:Uncharacterized protein n=1 Tax=Tegillarca granosa TaxID=220873 RepID=A0ABQ9FKU0_TEGGR|nr:hypothetical protein KUTeg_002994 [Tegillarca granosa]
MERTYTYAFERNETLTFHAWDYVVWVFTLVASAAIGLYYAIKDRHRNDSKEFMLGGRKLYVFPVALSLVSSFISAVTLLGTPAEMYLYDTMFWWISGGFIISAIGAGHIFIPVFYRLGITSVFEYIEMRFGRAVRLVSSLVLLVWMFLYLAIVLYGPSLALHAVTGLDLWGSVVAVGLVCTFYTTLGGMKAVVWTDSLQVIFMFSGMIALLVAGSNKLGGFGEVWRIANENGRIRFFDFDPDPTARHSIWSVVIGGGFFWGCVYGVNQAQVQRAISLPSVRKMRYTISSGLNAIAAVIVKDFVKPYCWKHPTDFHETIFSKGIGNAMLYMIVSGLLCLIMAYVVSELGAILQLAYILFGVLGGPLLGVFTLGILFPWANKWGALVGHLTALALLLWIGLGTKFENVVVTPKSPVTIEGCRMNDSMTTHMTTLMSTISTTVQQEVTKSEPLALYKMSYMWYTALATLTNVVVGLIISFITGYTRPETLNPKLICPVFDELFPYLPEKIRKPLRFGVRHGQETNEETEPEKQKPIALDKNGIDNKAFHGEKQEKNEKISFSYDDDEKKQSVTEKQANGINGVQPDTEAEKNYWAYETRL